MLEERKENTKDIVRTKKSSRKTDNKVCPCAEVDNCIENHKSAHTVFEHG